LDLPCVRMNVQCMTVVLAYGFIVFYSINTLYEIYFSSLFFCYWKYWLNKNVL
jgi:hypothetical protein